MKSNEKLPIENRGEENNSEPYIPIINSRVLWACLFIATFLVVVGLLWEFSQNDSTTNQTAANSTIAQKNTPSTGLWGAIGSNKTPAQQHVESMENFSVTFEPTQLGMMEQIKVTAFVYKLGGNKFNCFITSAGGISCTPQYQSVI